jgi:hypothetical protein
MTAETKRPTKRSMVLLATLLICAVLGYVAFKVGTTDQETQTNRLPSEALDTAGQFELGKSIYISQCAACHGANLEGQPNWRQRNINGRLSAPPHDKNGHMWHHDDATLFKLTKYGLSALIGQPVETDMPIYKVF